MKKHLIWVLALGMCACQSQQVTEQEQVGYPVEEYGQARVILMHEPGEEQFDGVIHPAAGLFENYFNIEKASKEHQEFISLLRKYSCKVYRVQDIMMEIGLDTLRALAQQSLTYIPEDSIYKSQVLDSMSRTDMIKCILLRPTIQLYKTDNNTGVAANYQHDAVCNLFFMRDQSIVTPRGVIIGKMNSPQRALETPIVRMCYQHLGYNPYYEIQGESSRLEGGDYMPFNTISLIGCGMRTNMDAIQEMFDHDAFGHDTVVVINERRHGQDQKHLDTYFNIIDKDLVTMCDNRYNATPDDVNYLTCNIYARTDSGYTAIAEETSFREWLENRGIKILVIGEEDARHYAINYLTLSPRHICAIAGQSQAFEQALKDNNVRVHWISADNLIQGYGAAHCMTQVIIRARR